MESINHQQLIFHQTVDSFVKLFLCLDGESLQVCQ